MGAFSMWYVCPSRPPSPANPNARLHKGRKSDDVVSHSRVSLYVQSKDAVEGNTALETLGSVFGTLDNSPLEYSHRIVALVFQRHFELVLAGNLCGKFGKAIAHLFIARVLRDGGEGCFEWGVRRNARRVIVAMETTVPHFAVFGAEEDCEYIRAAQTDQEATFVRTDED